MKERFWIKPLAFGLGLIAWIYVNMIPSNLIEREIEVNIDYLNKPDGTTCKILPESYKAKIKLKGPRSSFIFDKLEERVGANVDLLNTPSSGAFSLEVCPMIPTEQHIELISLEPARLFLRAIPLVNKVYPIKVNLIGKTPEGYLPGRAIPSREYINVILPEEKADKVSDCRIDIFLEGVTRSINEIFKASIVYVDGHVEKDLRAENIMIPDNDIQVFLPITEGYPEKELIPRIEFLNKTPEGRKLESCSVIPETVTVSGPERILNSLSDISLEPVDLSGVNRSSEFPVNVKCPKGLKIVGSESVLLSIKYVDVPVVRTIEGLKFEIIHNDDHKVTTTVSSYSICLEGLIDQIDTIKAEELNNLINVKGYKTGSYTLPLTVPNGIAHSISVKGIIPSEIPVVIEQIQKESVDNPKSGIASSSEKIDDKPVSVNTPENAPAKSEENK